MDYFCNKLSFTKSRKETTMKKMILAALMLVCGIALNTAQAQTTEEQKGAEIKFEKVTHNFGTFSEKDGRQTCTFKFSNVGDKPLIIHQAMAACGCTVPEYTKKPVMPGEQGEIKVTYDGTGKKFGAFKKLISVRTNGIVEITRLYIEGVMTE